MGFRTAGKQSQSGRRGLAMSLVIGLLGAGGVVTFGLLGMNRIEVDCSVLERATAAEASAVALFCDAEVEVLAERSPWVTVHARPDGTSKMTVDAVPQHTDVNGVWEPVDANVLTEAVSAPAMASGGGSLHNGRAAKGFPLQMDPAIPPGLAGMLPVAAPVFPMWFNPGGEAGAGLPLGVLERDGQWVKMWFPLPLPVPVVDGRSVSYELSQGVTLVVSVMADGAGFRPIVVLDSPQAAVWFSDELADARASQGLPGAGYEIPYRMETSAGLSLRGVDEVGFEFVADDDEVLFWSPPSIMWDSSGGDIGESRLVFPLEGDRTVRMPVRVDEGDVVVLSPDEQMLTSPQTVWPVQIDPTVGGRTPAEWVQIRTGGFTSPIYKWEDTTARNGRGLGNCLLSWSSGCSTSWKGRLVWEFGSLGTWMTPLVGSDIVSATFSAKPGGRGNCTSSRTDAHATKEITSTQRTWSTLPFSNYQSNVTGPQGTACSDNGVRREWNVKSAVMAAADANSSKVTIGLKANNETNSNGYKTYRADARLEFVYNRAPDAPSDVKLASPVASCLADASRPLIATATPTLSAVASDPDGGNVQVQFQVLDQDTEDVVWDSGNLAAKASGSTFTVEVPTGVLVNDGVYRYQAMASDGSLSSGWSTQLCEFGVDTEAPAAPTVIALREGADAVYDEGVERGGVGLLGKFLLDRGISNDVTSFSYSFNSTTLDSTIAPDSEGTAVISFEPVAAGPVTLRVAAWDAAGNQTTSVYVFDVAAPKEDAIWSFDEGSGELADDSSGVTPAKQLSIVGASWVAGPHELFDSRPGDFSLRFDGAADHASTGPIVDTTKSFVASAFVWLDSAALGSAVRTAVSQDGVDRSGFALSYLPSCAGMVGGCWSFGMTDADQSPADVTSVNSTVPVTGERWVHLLGEHNAAAGTITLWVCEIGTPADPALGEPVSGSVSRTATPWQASGAFAVGRGLAGGDPAEWWQGRVDNVRVYSGQVVAEAKIRRLCQGAEPTDFNIGLDALDPTTANGE